MYIREQANASSGNLPLYLLKGDGILEHSFPSASHSWHSEEHCNTSAYDHMNPLYTVYIQHSKHSIKTKIISSNPCPSSTPFSLTALLHPSPHFSLMLSPTQRSEMMLSMFTTRTLHYCAQEQDQGTKYYCASNLKFLYFRILTTYERMVKVTLTNMSVYCTVSRRTLLQWHITSADPPGIMFVEFFHVMG